MDLTDAQWELIKSLIPERSRRADGRGRPPRDPRDVMNGIFWIMRTGAAWRDMPGRYPSGSTCHRYFQAWVNAGAFVSMLNTLAEDLMVRGRLDLSECFIDATFVPAKKGGECVGKTKRGKGSKIMVIADRHGLPISVHVSSASPHESRLVESTLNARFVADEPRRLIGDKAYDSDPLDTLLASRGIEMIAPHRANRRKPKTQDGRPLRRYRRRWMIERLNTWLQNQRRVVVRYERKIENYFGFVHLACLRILLLNYF